MTDVPQGGTDGEPSGDDALFTFVENSLIARVPFEGRDVGPASTMRSESSGNVGGLPDVLLAIVEAEHVDATPVSAGYEMRDAFQGRHIMLRERQVLRVPIRLHVTTVALPVLRRARPALGQARAGARSQTTRCC